ncbi:MAG: hypothetical protein P1U40_01375 [Coxiellaceae bacterium]|nr:hypothetical protein [Coxiellaceae bacterium]
MKSNEKATNMLSKKNIWQQPCLLYLDNKETLNGVNPAVVEVCPTSSIS